MFSAGVPPRFREKGYFCNQKAMRILIYLDNLIPARTYGGTERVMWYLGKELARMGHTVYFLCHPGSTCDFATVIPHDPRLPFDGQVPTGVDVIHFNNCTMGRLEKPYIVTHHGNFLQGDLDRNSVFVSADHARRHGSASFVYNGLDWSDYGDPGLRSERRYYHFLGKAAWRIKNVQGAIDTVKALPGERLLVLGGYRLNLKMGLRLTLTPKARFAGMVGGERKNELLRHSKGLIFPVRWDEPFGLAITESLYFGAPVFVVRFLTATTPEVAERTQGINAVCLFFFYLPLIIIGLCGAILLPGIEAQDRVFLTLVTQELHPIGGGVIFAAVVAAIISTADSILLLAAATFSNDVYAKFKKVSDQEQLKVSRIATLVIGVASVGLSFFMEDAILFIQAKSVTLMGSAMAMLTIVGVMWKRANKAGAIGCMVSGLATACIWYALGEPYGIMAALPGIIVSFIVMVVVSSITTPPPVQVIEKFFPEESK